MSPKRTAEYKEGQRGEIMAAARRLFVESGYDRATLRGIAREAGVSTGAIYTYFRTKAELLAAICREQAAVQEATLRGALASLPPDWDRFAAAFRVALAPFLEASGEEARRRELVNLLFWYEATRDPAVGAEMRSSLDSSRAAVLAGLREERAAGRLREDLDLDEELALWEERDLLLARLVECKTFKDAALALLALEDDAKASYPRRAAMEERFLKLTPDLLEGVSPDRLRRAFIKAVTPKPEPPKVSLAHVTQIRMTVTDAMEELVEQLPRIKRATFRQLTAKYGERMEVIVHFLGLLELYKLGRIDLEQVATFGELQVVWTGEENDNVFADLRQHELADAYEG